MKTLLLILMLGAGFVSVVSALEPLDCTNNTTNQCCVDLHSIESAINQSPTKSITTIDKYEVLVVGAVLVNDGTDVDNGCLDYAGYKQNDQRKLAVFQWAPGDWVDTIGYDFTGSCANKNNAIIHANNHDAGIITNN